MHQLSAGTRKTRKPHECFHCGETIPAGSVVAYQANVEDGQAYTLYLHPECDAACTECGWRDGECFGYCCKRGSMEEQ